MTDLAERFIDAAVSPLSDNAEMEIAARRLLEGALDKSDAAIPPGTVERLTRPAGLLRHWQAVLVIVAIIAGAVIGVMSYRTWASNTPHMRALGGIVGKIPGLPGRTTNENPIGKGLSPKERLLLLGDESRRSKSDRWKALWDSEPENPAFYIDYVTAFYSDHKTVPPGFLEKANELDPTNAWFPAHLSGILALDSADPIKRTPAEVEAEAPAKYTIKDEAKLRESRVLFGKAARLPQFDSHQRALLSRRVALLPLRTTAFDHVPAVAYVAGQSSAALPMRGILEMIGAECVRMAQANDTAGLRELIRDWDAFVTVLVPSEDAGLVDLMVKNALLSGGYRSLARAAEATGMEDEAKRLGRIWKRLKAYRDEKKHTSEGLNDFSRESSSLAALALPVVQKQVLHPPELGERLKPGRLAEHEFATKYATAFIACLWFLLLAPIIAAYRFRGGTLHRLLSARFEKLITIGDWILILGMGVLLPFLLHQLILRSPWMGGREWSIAALKFLTPGASITLVTSLMTILPVAIARHRLEKRAGFVGLQWRRAWLTRDTCALVVLAIPLAGPILLPWKISPVVSICAIIVLMIPQLWMIAVAFRGLFSSTEHLLKRVTLSRVVMPAYVLAFLLTMLSLPLSHALEKYWVSKDELMEITPEAPSMSRYEDEITQTLKKEILEVLELK